MRFLPPLVLVLVSMTHLMGCSGSDPEGPPRYPIKGKLTLDGEVLAGATIQFHPKKGPMAATVSGDNGEFQFEAVAGVHKVVVLAHAEGGGEVPAGDDDPDDDPDGESSTPDVDVPETDDEEEIKSVIPAAYSSSINTPLTFEVKEQTDPNEANLDVSSS
jgi:hypothetical protein